MKRFNSSYLVSRRFRLLLCIISLLILYLLIWMFTRYRLGSEFIKTDQLYVCIEDRIRPLTKKIAEFDAFHFRSDDSDMGFLTFVGNGHIGASFQNDYLLLRIPGLPLKSVEVSTLVSLDVDGYISDVSYVLDTLDGVMHKISCFKHENELCVSSGMAVYAHRVYPSLLVQSFLAYNPLPVDVTVKVNKPDLREIKGTKTLRTIRLKQNNLLDGEHSETVTYQIVSVLLDEPSLSTETSNDPNELIGKVTVVVLFEPVLPENLSIKSGRTKSYSLITGIRASTYAIPVTRADMAHIASEHGVLGQERKMLESIILSELSFALLLGETDLRRLHTTAWNRLWLSGLTLSYSHAPNALNGQQINMTFYYLAANAVDHYAWDNEGNRTIMEVYQNRSRRKMLCSPTVDLVTSENHWKPVRTVNQLNTLLTIWNNTFEAAQCRAYAEDGAHGVIQAALTVVGLIHHYDGYTTVGLLPTSLNRDVIFRRIELSHPGVWVNFELKVVPGEVSLSSPHLLIFELRVWRAPRPPQLGSLVKFKAPRLQPALSRSGDVQPTTPIRWFDTDDETFGSDVLVWMEKETETVPVFTCPAACHHGPIEVGHSKVPVPFLVTRPTSASLYFATNKEILQEHTQKVQYSELKVGPNPDHDLVNLHRYGHVFGGLPWLFWISLGLLITLFHLFFCKVIYNELVRDKSDLDAENAWRLPRIHHDLRSPEAAAARLAIKAELASRRRHYKHTDRVP